MTLKGRRTKFGGARDLRKRLVIGFGSTPREKSSAERDQLGLSTGHSLFGALVVALVVIATGIGFTRLHGREAAGPQSNANTATYVGSAARATCHEAQSRLWQGSHHQQAMAHATASTVLGNFDDATFDYNGVRS